MTSIAESEMELRMAWTTSHESPQNIFINMILEKKYEEARLYLQSRSDLQSLSDLLSKDTYRGNGIGAKMSALGVALSRGDKEILNTIDALDSTIFCISNLGDQIKAIHDDPYDNREVNTVAINFLKEKHGASVVDESIKN